VWAAIVALICSELAPPFAQAAAPVGFDFEADAATAGWTASPGGVALSITHEAERVRRGKGALLCSYTALPGAGVSLSRTDLEVAGARSFALSLRTSSQTPFALRLVEKDGSAYQLFVTTLAGKWCEVVTPLSDFQLEDGSADEDGKLDAEQITTLTLQWLVNLPGEMGDILGTQTGPQTVVLDDLSFRAEEVPSRSSEAGGKITADSFEGSALYVLSVGRAVLDHVPGHAGAAVEARFAFAQAGPRAWPGIVVPVGHLKLGQAKVVRLRLRALGPMRFQVLAEEQDSSRYWTAGELATGGEWLAKDLRLADFKLDPSRQDENGVLDPGQLRVIVVVADCFNVLLDETARSAFALDDVIFLEQ
jgi:hypothetical protein